MASAYRERLGSALERFALAVSSRPRLALALVLVSVAACGAVAATSLGVNSETDDVFDPNLPFRQARSELDRALPPRNDNLLVVLDAPTRTSATDAAAQLAAQLVDEPDRFASAFAPGAGPFFDRHGLLFLELDELEKLSDELAGAQPFLAEVTRDPSLRGVFGQLTLAVERGGASGDADLHRVLESVTEAIVSASRLEMREQAFGEVVLGGDETGPVRRFVIVEPRPDYTDFVPGRASVTRLHEILAERGWNADGPIRARVTGDLALKTEELGLVKSQAASAGVTSFVLVGMILWFAQRSGRLILATLLALVSGLVWTAAFAALAIGHLNVISVAFAVLFIGLGVDFGIHLTLRYREVREDASGAEALGEAVRGVGGSLVLCAGTTALGFYAFVPTGFLGVAELGVISGTGMVISLFGTLVVIPAVLALGGGRAGSGSPAGRFALPSWPTRYPRAVCAAALALALAGLAVLPRLHFDANPLRVRDPNAASVRTFFELLEGGDVNPWSIEILTPDLAAADALASRLEALPSVDRTSTLSSYLPDEQEAKLEVIEDVALFLGLGEFGRKETPDLATEEASIRGFRKALAGMEEAERESSGAHIARELGAALDVFVADLNGAAADVLRNSLVQSVLDRVERLETSLTSEGVRLADLPEVVRARMIAQDGRAIVEVYPSASLNDDAFVDAFVTEVRAHADQATGTAVYMVEAATAILDSLRQALLTALVAVAALLLAVWRSPRNAGLVLAPLMLAALLTASAAVLLGLPINFANVIVVPLLLGIGVDSGIHLVDRYRAGAGADSLLDTSTSRAVFWSALTTISSFGALGLASHRGLATLGQLLTLGVSMTLLCNLVFLPALLALTSRGDRAEG